MQDSLMDDAACGWLVSFIDGFQPRPRRVIAIGGSSGFIAELVGQGYPVIYADKDPDELRYMAEFVAEKFGIQNPDVIYTQFDLEHWVGQDSLELAEHDCVIFCRSLHHMLDPARAVANVLGRLSQGVILIADLTTELSSKIIEYQNEEREHERIFLARQNRQEELSALEREWKLCDTLNAGCDRMLAELKLNKEADAQQFIRAAAMNNPLTFYYTLSCPCGNWNCGKTVWYWFAAIHKTNVPLDE